MEHYILKTNQHLFNECLYVLKGKDYVVQPITFCEEFDWGEV
jgi:hypothetical protein